MELLQSLKDRLRNEQHTKDTETQSGLDTTETDKRIAALNQQIAEAESQQEHENRIQDATNEITTRLDTLYLGGQTLRELCADEEAYQILRISFTQDYISQATKNSEVLSQVQADAQQAIKLANDRANELDGQNTILLQKNHKLNLDLEDITNKYKAATALLEEAPSNEITEELKRENADLRAQLALKAKADEPKGDAKSQIDAMVLERENKKVKIINLRLADSSGINTKDYLATDVLTGEELKIHSNYIRSYKEVTAEEAEQLRADEANRLQELEAQNEAIPTQEAELEPVHSVLEKEAPAEEITFQPETRHELGEGLQLDGEHIGHEVPEEAEESEVITLESLHERVKALELKVAA